MNSTPTQLSDGWVKSSASANGAECVKLKALSNGEIALGSTRLTDAEPIPYTKAELRAFLAGVKNGEFDYLAE